MNGILTPSRWIILSVVGSTLSAAAAEDPVHEELRTLRTNVVNAIQAGDVDRQLESVHTNAVVIWQNGEVARGHQGLREFYERLGKQAFQGYKVPPAPAELTILYGGDTGVSYGESVAEYTLFGRGYQFTNHWTATLVKEDGAWKLASYQVALNALDNPILDAAKKGLFVASGITGVIGVFLGIVIGRSLNKAQRSSST